jgi:muramoyltetrapeptide carboxypeptidase LdcA involved in peptidoglycan recycling
MSLAGNFDQLNAIDLEPNIEGGIIFLEKLNF